MFIFYGSRASKLKSTYSLDRSICPYCESKGTLNVSSYGRYAHVFFIPLFPLSKKKIIECSHCKTSYHPKDLSPETQEEILRTETSYPSKRPIWHGCGCLLIIGIIITASIASWLNPKEKRYENSESDVFQQQFESDLDKVRVNPEYEQDSCAHVLAQCFDFALVDEMNREKIAFMTRRNGTKMLVLVKMDEIKEIKRSQRKEVLNLVKECLSTIDELNDVGLYIGVYGKYSMMVACTPYERDDLGIIASDDILFPFYEDETTQDTTVIEMKRP